MGRNAKTHLNFTLIFKWNRPTLREFVWKFSMIYERSGKFASKSPSVDDICRMFRQITKDCEHVGGDMFVENAEVLDIWVSFMGK